MQEDDSFALFYLINVNFYNASPQMGAMLMP